MLKLNKQCMLVRVVTVWQWCCLCSCWWQTGVFKGFPNFFFWLFTFLQSNQNHNMGLFYKLWDSPFLLSTLHHFIHNKYVNTFEKCHSFFNLTLETLEVCPIHSFIHFLSPVKQTVCSPFLLDSMLATMQTFTWLRGDIHVELKIKSNLLWRAGLYWPPKATEWTHNKCAALHHSEARWDSDVDSVFREEGFSFIV